MKSKTIILSFVGIAVVAFVVINIALYAFGVNSSDIYIWYFKSTHPNPVVWNNIEIKYKNKMYYEYDADVIRFFIRSEVKHPYIFSYRKEPKDIEIIIKSIQSKRDISDFKTYNNKWNNSDATYIEYVDNNENMFHEFLIIPDINIAAIFIGPDKNGSELTELFDSATILQ